jgi:hypothetical protein
MDFGENGEGKKTLGEVQRSSSQPHGMLGH